jgi:hypothetical protein
MSLVEQFNLPEGAIPNGCIGVCQFIDADGEMKFAVIYDSDNLPLSSTLGLLELAKFHMYEISMGEDK